MSRSLAEPYCYTPLQRPDFIRILELLPGPSGSPLHCRLIERIPGDDMAYEALSYTWNGNVLDHNILIEESASQGLLRITQNLHDALQALRKPDQRCRLWVDAVCIDQSDAQEKSYQVPRMGSIFRDAVRVIVWLGPEDLRVMEALREAISRPEDFDTPIAKNSLRWLKASFITLPWFERMWTVQEFLLGRDVIFLLGRHWIYPRDIYKSLEKLDAWVIRSTRRDTWGTVLRQIRATTGIFHLRTQLRASIRSEIITLADCVLGIGRRRTCTDPRDLIYGMLGIANDAGIVCDYSLSLTQVRTDFVHKSLRSGDLSLLHYCNFEQGFPSYIPSLENRLEVEYFPIRSSNSPFGAGQRYPLDLRLGPEQTISLKGVYIDVVEHHEPWENAAFLDMAFNKVSDETRVAQDVRYCLHKHYKRLRNDQRPILDELGPTIEYENIFEVIGRSMDLVDTLYIAGTADHAPRTIPSPHGNHVRHEATHDLHSLDHQHFSQIRDKSIMRTVRGYVGFASLFMVPGDLVVIFDGAKTPFILRKEMDEHNEHTKRYMLISDCYLHKWMYGDYFGHTVLDESEDLPAGPSNQPNGVPSNTRIETSSQAARGKDSGFDTRDSSKRILKKQTFVIC